MISILYKDIGFQRHSIITSKFFKVHLLSTIFKIISIKLKLENKLIDIQRTDPNLENLEQAINYMNEEKRDIKKRIIELKEDKKLNEEINDLKSFNKTLKEENDQIKK